MHKNYESFAVLRKQWFQINIPLHLCITKKQIISFESWRVAIAQMTDRRAHGADGRCIRVQYEYAAFRSTQAYTTQRRCKVAMRSVESTGAPDALLTFCAIYSTYGMYILKNCPLVICPVSTITSLKHTQTKTNLIQFRQLIRVHADISLTVCIYTYSALLVFLRSDKHDDRITRHLKILHIQGCQWNSPNYRELWPIWTFVDFVGIAAMWIKCILTLMLGL